MTHELFLEDSYLTQCKAEITDIQEGKVVLNQTVFYPTGGGQEHDLGVIQQGNHAVKVTKVKKENGQIYHYVESADQLLYGPVNVEIDWERRYAFMRHHSMLHIIGAIFNRKYGSLATGNQIYADKARIDLTNIIELDPAELNETIQEANVEINKNHPIQARILPRDEAANISDYIKTVVNLVPSHVKEIRLVSIGNIDEQACGGTHVRETREIGQVVLEKTKSKGKGAMRLELKIV
nr:alanyl-tRNA editing protein [Lysinibacillus timonensis]